MRCWKCGTLCTESPAIGPYCPSRDCDVVDGVGLTREEFEARQSQYAWLQAMPRKPLHLSDDDARALDAAALQAGRGQVLMVKTLQAGRQGDDG